MGWNQLGQEIWHYSLNVCGGLGQGESKALMLYKWQKEGKICGGMMYGSMDEWNMRKRLTYPFFHINLLKKWEALRGGENKVALIFQGQTHQKHSYASLALWKNYSKRIEIMNRRNLIVALTRDLTMQCSLPLTLPLHWKLEIETYLHSASDECLSTFKKEEISNHCFK